jgi:DNA-directed RNA polymerase subunit omega
VMTCVTVEDCRRMVSNRFELVLLAAERARSLKVGALPLVDVGRDAPPILALREIAAGRASPAHLRDLAWRRRVLLAVPVTGSNEVAPRSMLSSDEEPELRDETDDERFEEDEAGRRLVEEGGGVMTCRPEKDLRPLPRQPAAAALRWRRTLVTTCVAPVAHGRGPCPISSGSRALTGRSRNGKEVNDEPGTESGNYRH